MEIQDILRNLQIEQLTPMQEATREAYRENKDLVLLSPTGSGKTLAFLLPPLFWCPHENWHCRLKRYSNPWGPRLKL